MSHNIPPPIISPVSAWSSTRVMAPGKDSLVALALTTNTAYWVYLGCAFGPFVANYVRGQVTVVGAGAQTAELALASSPLAPCRSSQTLTALWTSGSVSDLTQLGLFANTAPIGLTIPAGTHLWAGIRTAMAGGQPTIRASTLDLGQGAVLTTATPGALTGGGPWTGLVPTPSTTGQSSYLIATTD